MTAEPVASIPDPRENVKSPARLALEEVIPTLLENPSTPYRFYREATRNQARNLLTASQRSPLKPEAGTLRVSMRKNDLTNTDNEAMYDLYAVYTND